MKTNANKGVKIMLAACVLTIAFGIASCNKESESYAPENIQNEENLPLATKEEAKDTLTLSGSFKGGSIDVTVIIDWDNCTYQIEGEIVRDGNTYQINGGGSIKAKNFTGTITNSQGQEVEITDEWQDYIYGIVSLFNPIEAYVDHVVDSIANS